ncbi:hypothetical protein [Nocardioides sp.]|uniref:hypothetical protein n=1 Tax=Nocardioides sp. TaxID=35761 RepID=UPI00286E138C|nr:hypothetical protein [Nocardioides sp.]
MSHTLRSHTLRRVAGLVAVSTLAVTAIGQPVSAAPTAPANTDDGAITLAGTWLKGQLTGGLVVGEFGPDYGLTIDTGLALDQAGDKSGVATVNAALQPKITEYIAGDAFGDAGSTYAGATAKAATFARVAGANTTSYGGVNLITRLEERVSATAPIVGRLEDKSSFGDFANVIGQGYAVRALTEAKSKRTADATAFLLAQQCASGFFRESFSKSKTTTAQGCVEGQADSAASLDTTALTVVNLLDSGSHDKAVAAAVAKAGTWLATQQKATGAFGADGVGANTNSTGLAGWALGLLKNREAATRAAVWVRKQQPIEKNKCRSALTKETGAIAYQPKVVRDARNDGITDKTADQWRRATAQAMAVLQWAPASADALTVSSARKSGEAGDKVRFKVSGLAPGERACVAIKGDFKRIAGKVNAGPVVRRLELPTGNRSRIVKVKTADTAAKTTIQVRN